MQFLPLIEMLICLGGDTVCYSVAGLVRSLLYSSNKNKKYVMIQSDCGDDQRLIFHCSKYSATLAYFQNKICYV